MSKVVLVCGKLCSGKTTYSQNLCEQSGAVLLSCDRLMLTLFPEDLGDSFGKFSGRSQDYLFNISADIVKKGIDVVLDWGFWTSTSRSKARKYYADKGISCEMHYLDVSDTVRKLYIEKRNNEVDMGQTSAYFVDSGLEEKFRNIFEKPSESEIDVWVKYSSDIG